MFVIGTTCTMISKVTVCKQKSEILEKINIIKKKIKLASKIDKTTYPIKHKVEWKQIYSLTTELRRDIDCHEINYKKYNMAFDIETSNVE
jgi:hypothetical protein